MRLKIFSDQQYLLKSDTVRPHPMLLPFWSHFTETGDEPWINQHERYREIAHTLFEMVPLEEADFAVMPDDWRTVTGELWYSQVNQQAQELYLQFAQRAEAAGKPLIVFFGCDRSDDEVPSLKNAFIFRHSCYRSQKKPHHFVWPSFCEDFVQRYFENQLPIRQKQEKPTVGFCGLTKRDSWKFNLKRIAYYLYILPQGKIRTTHPPFEGHILRNKVIEILKNSDLVKTNFITYDRMVFLGKKSLDQRKQSRDEYIQNMRSSDYVVCCRGTANFSNRLFETLCCGRIPILIDTDCSLPYDFIIDWKKYCVWIDEKEITNIGQKVAEFHNNLSPQEFVDLQLECRRFWQEWLSTEGFFSKFHLHFKSVLIAEGRGQRAESGREKIDR
ncbi:MAG: exostosin family protein [Symploca sp. SIO1B1]|nr:exostosin family protein [Symploca sp. SIO1B1]